MTKEEVLIKYIQEYIDIGMWQYEACDLNKEDLEVIIKALAKHDYFIDKINRESYIRGYNKAMSNISLAYDKSDYPEESNYYVYQELNKWEKEGVPNEQ